jgi:hypothetical protein
MFEERLLIKTEKHFVNFNTIEVEQHFSFFTLFLIPAYKVLDMS